MSEQKNKQSVFEELYQKLSQPIPKEFLIQYQEDYLKDSLILYP